MISQKLLSLFQDGLNKFDKELETYKKDNKINKPIYHHYFTTVWIVPPYLREKGLYVDPKTPDFIVQQYSQIYNNAVIESSKP